MKIERAEAEQIISEIVSRVDYDIWKQLDPELNETGPEDAHEMMTELSGVLIDMLDEL